MHASHISPSVFLQMSRITLESKSPTWGKTDLRMTRIKDTDKGEVLNFKEISWQTVRIEAKSTMNEELTPLRLITNQARCRITIKKRINGRARFPGFARVFFAPAFLGASLT